MSLDVWNTPIVPLNSNLVLQARNGDVAIQLRQGPVNQPPDTGGKGHKKDSGYPENCTQNSAQDPPTLRLETKILVDPAQSRN